MNSEGERAQTRIRADIARRPFAPDVLLARRQGQNPAAPPLRVDGLPDETPRHLAQEPLTGGEQSDVRSTKVEGVTERLAFRSDDVGAHFTRRANSAERQDLGDNDDEQGAGLVADPCELGVIADFAKEIGVLNDDAGSIAI